MKSHGIERVDAEEWYEIETEVGGRRSMVADRLVCSEFGGSKKVKDDGTNVPWGRLNCRYATRHVFDVE